MFREVVEKDFLGSVKTNANGPVLPMELGRGGVFRAANLHISAHHGLGQSGSPTRGRSVRFASG
jgi:hypothetical protein